MAKGLRLNFLGITCMVSEVRAMIASLGYNSMPMYKDSYGRGGCRNFLGLQMKGKLYETCESLRLKGLMSAEIPPKYYVDAIVFHLNETGKRWFGLFKRHHHHPKL